MRRSLLPLLAAVLVVSTPALAGAADPFGGDLFDKRTEADGVAVDADSLSYDRDKGILEARGDVVITNGETVIVADEVEIRRESSDALLRGRVVLEDPAARIRASRAAFNLDDEVGVLDDAEIYLPLTRFQLRGKWISKGLGQSYRIRDGVVTTCQCEDGAPDWSIAGREVDVDIEGWGRIYDGVFKVKDVPIFYLPYGLIPVGQDRQTGFLFPRFGISNQRGFQYVQPFFWEIDKSQDLTLTLDVETSARIGLLADYRYLLSPEAGGRLAVSYFNEHIGGNREQNVVDPEDLADPSIPENRWSVVGQHRQPGPWGSSIYARPFLVSDNLFLREMNILSFLPAQAVDLTTLRYTKSDLGILEPIEGGFLKAEANWYQDLIQEQRRVAQPLPKISFLKRANLLDGRLSIGLNAEGVYYYRGEWATGGRINIAPEVSVPYNLGPYGYGSVRLVLRETAYYLTDNEIPVWPPTDDEYETRAVSRFQHRETLEVKANFNTELSRVFDVQRGDLLKLKHVIQPYLAYDYVPDVNQDDLPLWDALDRINYRNLVTYGVSTRLLGKFKRGGLATAGVPAGETEGNPLVGEELYGPPMSPIVAPRQPTEVRELARAYVQQSYSLTRPLIEDRDDRSAYFSAVDVGLRVSPVEWAAIRSRAVISVADRSLLFAEVGARLFDPRPRGDGTLLPGLRPVNSATLFYQFNSGGTLENINLATTYRLNNYIAASYLGRYDVLAGRFLENWIGLRLLSLGDCWVFDVAFVDRVNPDEQEFRFQVSLVGLGSFGQSPFRENVGGFPQTGGFGSQQGGLY